MRVKSHYLAKLLTLRPAFLTFPPSRELPSYCRIAYFLGNLAVLCLKSRFLTMKLMAYLIMAHIVLDVFRTTLEELSWLLILTLP